MIPLSCHGSKELYSSRPQALLKVYILYICEQEHYYLAELILRPQSFCLYLWLNQDKYGFGSRGKKYWKLPKEKITS